MAKNSKQAFVNAVRAKGGAKYMDLGGPTTPTLAPQVTTQGDPSAVGWGKAVTPFATVDPTQAFSAVGDIAKGIATDFTAQNGYQAQLAPTTNLDYTGVIGQAANNAQAGYGQNQGNIAQEQALAGQLGLQAQGQGPNPAQAALNNATGQNVANQAALAAGQRGASGNVGLMQRNIAAQGANTQQQAVGQAALMQAQQQLAAQQGQAALMGQIGNQVTNEQAINNQLFGAGAGAQNTQNANLISNYGQAQGINSGIAQNNANAVDKTLGGVLGGASSLMALLADGGEVSEAPKVKAAEVGAMTGAQVGEQGNDPTPKPIVSMDYTKGIDWAPQKYAEGGPISFAGQYLNGTPNEVSSFSVPSGGQAAPTPQFSLPSSQGDSGKGSAASGMAGAAKNLMAKGGKPVVGEELASKGMKVPGKAKVPGKDTLKNDTVPAMLSPGEIVIPKSIAEAPDAPKRAMAFVQAIQAKQGLKRGKRG